MEPPDAIKEQRSWVLAQEWLADRSKFAATWDVSTDTPSLGELEDALKKCPNHTGTNRDSIPTEIWKYSAEARGVLHSLIVRVWNLMLDSEPGELMEVPEGWFTATLVCLFKGKGARADPANYRGISLIDRLQTSCGSLTRPRWVKEPLGTSFV